MSKEEEKYKKVFVSESIDLLNNVSDDLLELEQEPDNAEVLNRLFRNLHTLKGGAALDGFDNISTLGHLMEDIFSIMRDYKISVTADYIDVFFEASDLLKEMIESISEEGEIANTDKIKEKLKGILEEISPDKDTKKVETDSQNGALLLNQSEVEILEKSQFNVYEVECNFNDDDRMKNINSLIILNNIKSLSKFVKSSPSEENIKIKNFDKFKIIVETELPKKALDSKIETNCKNYSINKLKPEKIRESFSYSSVKTEEDATKKDVSGYNLEKRIDNILNNYGNKFIEAIRKGERLWLIELNFNINDPSNGLMAYVIYNNLKSMASHIASTIKPEEFQKISDFRKVLFYVSSKELGRDSIDSIIQANCNSYTIRELEESQLKAYENKIDKKTADKKKDKKSSTAQSLTYIEVDKEIVDNVIQNIGEMVVNLSIVNQMLNSIVDSDFDDIDELKTEINQVSSQLNATSVLGNSLMDYTVLLRLVPIKILFKKFPRIIRDISRRLNKKARLILEGERTRMDQEILDAIEAPLLHMIRNSMDHGIEEPEERKNRGKPEIANIYLRAVQIKDRVNIEIIDDGKGMDKDKILNKAINKELIKEEKAKFLSKEEIFSFIYHPGFSTTEEVSQLSGRGVGMDVVATEINKVGGEIIIHSEKGKGTKITLDLPITL